VTRKQSDSSRNTCAKGLPSEILEPPVGAETCDPEHESAVVVQEIINPIQEIHVVANADVLKTKKLELAKEPEYKWRGVMPHLSHLQTISVNTPFNRVEPG
jgi:hypothetical protein